MKQSLLKSAAVVAAVIFGANGSFAADNVWTYYTAKQEGNPANAECIVQGDWVLSVRWWDAAKGYLQFNNPTILRGEGVLDLQNVKVQTADALVPIQLFDFDYAGGITNAVTEIWATHMKNIPQIQNNKFLRRLVFAGDALTEMRWKAYAGCVNMTNFQARCPNLLRYNSEVFTNVPITNDISELVSPCLQALLSGLPSSVTGTLKVTNQTDTVYVGGVTNLWLEGPFLGQNKNGVLGATGGADQFFRGNTNLISFTMKWPKIHRMGKDLGGHFLGSAIHMKDLCVYMPALTNLAGGEFGGLVNLEHLTMLGAPLPPQVMDVITAAFPARAASSEDRRVIMYCSKKQGWKALAAKLTPGTYEESAAPEDCFGVYTNSVGQRKAWMVHLPQDGDPTGLCIRVQ